MCRRFEPGGRGASPPLVCVGRGASFSSRLSSIAQSLLAFIAPSQTGAWTPSSACSDAAKATRPIRVDGVEDEEALTGRIRCCSTAALQQRDLCLPQSIKIPYLSSADSLVSPRSFTLLFVLGVIVSKTDKKKKKNLVISLRVLSCKLKALSIT